MLKSRFFIAVVLLTSASVFYSCEKKEDLPDLNDLLIKLPESAMLKSPLLNTIDSIRLTWTKSTMQNFKAYRLYQYNYLGASGHDNRYNRLIFTGTDLMDTIFTINRLNYTD